MCLSNFKAIRQFKVQISWLRDLTRSYEKTYFRILRRGPGSFRTTHHVDGSITRTIDWTRILVRIKVKLEWKSKRFSFNKILNKSATFPYCSGPASWWRREIISERLHSNISKQICILCVENFQECPSVLGYRFDYYTHMSGSDVVNCMFLRNVTIKIMSSTHQGSTHCKHTAGSRPLLCIPFMIQ